MIERHGDRQDRPITEPAHTLTSKGRSDVWVVDRRTNSKAAGGGMTATVTVPMDRPAPTMTGKSGGQWILRNGSQEHATERPSSAPAPTLLASADNGDTRWWPASATTVCADPRLSFRGHHDEDHRSLSEEEGAVKLTIEEGLILQSFRPDFPVQGTKSKKWEQIGNAIPPLLAAAVLGQLLEES